MKADGCLIREFPADIEAMVLRSDQLSREIHQLRKRRLTLAEWRRLADIQAELSRLCPPERYAWSKGRPVVDIIRELLKYQKEEEYR